MNFPKKIPKDEVAEYPMRKLEAGEEIRAGDYQAIGHHYKRFEEGAQAVGQAVPPGGSYLRPQEDDYSKVRGLLEDLYMKDISSDLQNKIGEVLDETRSIE